MVMEMHERFGLMTRDEAPVPLTGVGVHGTVTGRMAKVSIRQRFENRENNPIEAVYKFPMPEGSSVCGFVVASGDRILRGRVEERDEAFRLYDDALARGDGGYLLDEERPNIFTLSVGNVLPGHVVEIEISYVTTLESNGNEVRFFLPTTISPRYVPADMPDENGIPVRALVNPGFRLDVPYGLQLHLDIAGKDEIGGIECPSHAVRTSYGENAISVEFSSDTVAMDHDFVLTITRAKGFENAGYSFTDDEHGYVQLDFSPRLEGATGGRGPDEVIFVLDCSGSMGGPSIEQAKKALEVFLRGMSAGTRFNIYRFGSSFEKVFTSSVAYSPDTLNRALGRLALIDADLGGTELLRPLMDIYQIAAPSEGTRSIILLTDGQVGNESEMLDLVKRDSRTRLFTVGIGYGPNEYLVRQLARVSGGALEMVAPGERIEPKVLRLFNKVMKGAVESLVIDWGARVEQAPLRPTVHDGECVSLFARIPGGLFRPDAVNLHGMVEGKAVAWEVPVRPVEGVEAALPLLWARARISDLEEGVVSGEGSRQGYRKEKAVENEIVALAKQYGILSRDTSFVTVESRTDAQRTGAEIELRKVPSMLTRGWGGVCHDVADASYQLRPQRMMKHAQFASMPMSYGMADTCDEQSPTCFSVPESYTYEDVVSDQSVDELGGILSLQTAEGGFLLASEDQAGLMELEMTELQDAAARMANGGNDPFKLLCTAVILALLEHDFADRRDEWFAVTEKSRKWLKDEIARLSPTVSGEPLEDWAKDYVEGIAS